MSNFDDTCISIQHQAAFGYCPECHFGKKVIVSFSSGKGIINCSTCGYEETFIRYRKIEEESNEK